MKVLVCGGRDYVNAKRIETVLTNMKDQISCVVTGGARGVDFLASRWAIANEIKTCIYPAQWSKLGKAAGPVRNQRMLDEEKPDMVLAFPGGIGTADMVDRAKKAGITVLPVED